MWKVLGNWMDKTRRIIRLHRQLVLEIYVTCFAQRKGIVVLVITIEEAHEDTFMMSSTLFTAQGLKCHVGHSLVSYAFYSIWLVWNNKRTLWILWDRSYISPILRPEVWVNQTCLVTRLHSKVAMNALWICFSYSLSGYSCRYMPCIIVRCLSVWRRWSKSMRTRMERQLNQQNVTKSRNRHSKWFFSARRS